MTEGPSEFTDHEVRPSDTYIIRELVLILKLVNSGLRVTTFNNYNCFILLLVVNFLLNAINAMLKLTLKKI